MIDPNAQAFPSSAVLNEAGATEYPPTPGLTVRAEFALLAPEPDSSDIREMMAWDDVPMGSADDVEAEGYEKDTGSVRWHALTMKQRLAVITRYRVAFADALIQALNSTPPRTDAGDRTTPRNAGG